MAERMWDLDDLVSATGLARELGYSKAAVINWASRFASFPKEKLETTSCRVYSRREVTAWMRENGRL